MGGRSEYEKEQARIRGEEDARRDPGAGLIDLLTLGFMSNSSYNPPSDPVLKAHYDAGWDRGKKGK